MLKNESNPSLSPNPVTAVSDPVAEESPQTSLDVSMAVGPPPKASRKGSPALVSCSAALSNFDAKISRHPRRSPPSSAC